ncbi:MAG: N-acetylmuramoyl-L-alanine amidase [Acidobacteriota bacterium]
MKRLLLITTAALLALGSIVFAQSAVQAALRTPAGDKPLAQIHQNGQLYFSVEDVVTGLGGSIQPQGNGFSATLNNVTVAFGTESRFAVVREDLIELPAPAVVVDGKPFAPVALFQGFLSRAADLDVNWDSTARALMVRPAQRTMAGAQVSVTNVQGTTKVIVTLTTPVDYSILRNQTIYIIRFKSPIHPNTIAEEAHEDPYVTKTSFAGSDLRIQLTGPDVVGDSYKLENPFRVVLDLRKGEAPPNTPVPAIVAPRVQEDQPGIRTIVIDPGHGGKDVGATGPGGTTEKDTALMVCRKLASALEAKTGARVVLTRDDDTLIALDQRPALANQYKADLFLSIHMNAAVVKGARGSETYFLSADASDEVARRAAETENAPGRAGVASAPSSDLKLILWDLAQQDYLQESSRFASDLQEEMNAIAGIQNRGVKQAPFRVLVGASMPAALVEIAFISNPDEEAKLKDDKFVSTVVEALTRAVLRYKTDYETRIGLIRPTPPPAATPAAPARPATTTAKAGTGT